MNGVLNHALLVGLLLLGTLCAGAQEVITVTSAEELFANIGPDRTIQIRSGTYLLTGLAQTQQDSKYCRFIDSHDGPELIISNVENLKLIGLGKMPLLMVSPKYADVLEFQDCKNITIENIRAGHGPEKGYCTGGVLAFDNCKSITINKCSLYGCGTQGIGMYESTGLVCTETVIEECSYHIMSLMGSRNVEFTDCEFRNNREFDMVQLLESHKVRFVRCNFLNNTSDGDSWTEYALFRTRNATDITATNCSFEGNEMDVLVGGGSTVEIEATQKEKNNIYRKADAVD